MDIEKLYKQLTNVDIEEQEELWNERGKGYYGEFQVFCMLYQDLIGQCKILMNLNIPVSNTDKTTEIDLLLIHETGLYVFEVKHYKGTIYGNSDGKIWTQYFRTVKNKVFKNPILQNEYHVNALKNIFKDIPIKSFIIFTNNECNLKVTNSNDNVNLCTLYDMVETLNIEFNKSEKILSMEKIDKIFDYLSKYSNMSIPITIDGKEKNFSDWLQPTLDKFENAKNNYIKSIEDNNKKFKKVIIINIVVIIFIILIYNESLVKIETNYNNEIDKIETNYNNEIDKFNQKFEHIDEIDNDYITTLNTFFNVSDVSINKLSNNSSSFTATISVSKYNDAYGMALTKDSKYIVMTQDGKVFEYDVFGKSLNYNRFYNVIAKGTRDSNQLAKAQFLGVSENEIEYVKLTGIELYKLNVSKTKLKEDLELELYSK